MNAQDSRLFVVFTLDKGDMKHLRAQVRLEHIAFMKSIAAHAVIGGPLLDTDGETRNGGMYLIKANSLAEARQIAGDDPYMKAGLFEMAAIREWAWQTNNLT